MTSSDANPIQFWVSNELTYNETEVCGINPACWCQPIEIADSIPLQFQGDYTPSEHILAAFDEDGALVSHVALTESPDNVYFAIAPIPSVAGFYSLKVIPDGTVQTLADADTWTVSPGSFTTRTADSFMENGGTPPTASTPLAVPNGATVRFRTTVTITDFDVFVNQPVTLLASLTPNGVNVSPTAAYEFWGNVTDHVIDWVLKAEGGDATTLQLTLVRENLSSGSEVTIVIENGANMVISTQELVLLKSDCLDVKASHPCTKLATYTNASDYAGLQYSSLGTPTFQTRLPAMLFHEDSEEESEDHELSNDTIIEVSSKITNKKRLDIGFVPYYFHNKMRLVLAHQSVSIDNKGWIKRKEDRYDIDQGNRRYPLKKASVMLTDKNYIKRNLL